MLVIAIVIVFEIETAVDIFKVILIDIVTAIIFFKSIVIVIAITNNKLL